MLSYLFFRLTPNTNPILLYTVHINVTYLGRDCGVSIFATSSQKHDLTRGPTVTYLPLGVDLFPDLDVPLGVSLNQDLDAISVLVNRRNRYSSPEMV